MILVFTTATLAPLREWTLSIAVSIAHPSQRAAIEQRWEMTSPASSGRCCSCLHTQKPSGCCRGHGEGDKERTSILCFTPQDKGPASPSAVFDHPARNLCRANQSTFRWDGGEGEQPVSIRNRADAATHTAVIGINLPRGPTITQAQSPAHIQLQDHRLKSAMQS